MDLLSLTLEFCSEDVLFAFLYLADLGWCQFLKKSLVPMLTIKSYSLTDVSSYSPAAVLGFLSGDLTPYDIYRGKVWLLFIFTAQLHNVFTQWHQDVTLHGRISDNKTGPCLFICAWLACQTDTERNILVFKITELRISNAEFCLLSRKFF